ncbi:MAG: transglutaminase-like domain-containing protein [Nanoarchaeota archaeon]|nr:transglutaminase-like domain-containing protein [Nanoarchaeota archaeon]
MNLKILPLIVFTLFLASLVAAQGTWYYDAKELIISTGIQSSLTIDRESGANVDYILANVTFVPKDRMDQDVLSRDLNPEAYEEGGSYVFRWDDPSENELYFSVATKIRIKNSIKKVSDKVIFPVNHVPDDIKQFLEATDNIDITPEIIQQSSSLAAGKDDLYDVVFELAKWTKQNIEYDLSTITADVSQPSSWVFRTRIGVCDELTNLFISMCRSLGIPARFISGIAYTESPEFPQNWGAHGWAEVYFPNFGWIPFDPTYGEFGYVDPTHLVLQESVDSQKAATYYEWRGNDFEIKTKQLKIETELESSSGIVPAFISLTAKSLYDEVGFGSYNLIEATVNNPNEFYIATELGISKSSDLEIVGDVYQQILLKPFESKAVIWIVRLNDDFDEGYIYTFPFEVYSTRNSTALTSFTSTERDKVYGYSDVLTYSEQKLQEGEKSYSASVDLSCAFEKSNYFLNEKARVECAVLNTGNILLSDLEVCIENKCEIVELGITQSKTILSNVVLKEVGKQSFTATLESDEVSKVSNFETVVFDEPSIRIIELSFPEKVNYDAEFIVSFKLKKDSLSVPKTIGVILEKNGQENLWAFDSLENDKRFEISFLGKDLVENDNSFDLSIAYEDDFGRRFIDDVSFVVVLEDLTTVQKFKAFFNKIRMWVAKIFN